MLCSASDVYILGFVRWLNFPSFREHTNVSLFLVNTSPMIYITNHVDGATMKCGVVVLLPRDGAAIGLRLNSRVKQIAYILAHLNPKHSATLNWNQFNLV